MIKHQYIDNLRKLREENGLSQVKVSKYLGTTQQVYSRYENGKNEMPIRHLVALSKLYKVSSDSILGLK